MVICPREHGVPVVVHRVVHEILHRVCARSPVTRVCFAFLPLYRGIFFVHNNGLHVASGRTSMQGLQNTLEHDVVLLVIGSRHDAVLRTVLCVAGIRGARDGILWRATKAGLVLAPHHAIVCVAVVAPSVVSRLARFVVLPVIRWPYAGFHRFLGRGFRTCEFRRGARCDPDARSSSSKKHCRACVGGVCMQRQRFFRVN